MRVTVCTIVHHPEDARILHRQIRALLDAGHQVTYIAPVAACGVTPWPELTVAQVPRAHRRRRLGPLLAARRQLARHAGTADLLLLHDPELLLVLPLVRGRPVTVWDVHEDTAAALGTKAWLPRAVRRPVACAVRKAERLAERRLRLLLAEHSYAARFRREHPVVPNTAWVPPVPAEAGAADKVIYIGHLSPDRGAGDLVELARLLAPHGVAVDLVGPADGAARPLLEQAQAAGLLRWHGFVPNDRAVPMADGALAGLCLLHDEANFRQSLPSKVAEYMARGVPVVTTPLPLAAGLVDRHGCGLVVPFGDPAAAAAAVLRLREDPVLRLGLGRRGHQAARQHLGWAADAPAFVQQLEKWVSAHQEGEPGEIAARLLPDPELFSSR